MTLPTVTVEVAFGQLPTTPSPSWTDVTSRVVVSDGIKITGAGSRAGDSLSAGSLQVTFENEDGDFTPGKTGGTYGDMGVGFPIRVSTSTYDLWTGFVTDWRWEYRGGYSVAVCQASDITATLAKAKARAWMTAQHVNTADCTGYWPLNDEAGTTEPVSGFANTEKATVGTYGSDGVLSFGITADLSPDDETVAALTPSGNDCQYFYSKTATSHATTGDIALSVWVNPSSLDGDMVIGTVDAGVGYLAVVATTAGKIRVLDSSTADWGSAGTLTVGEWSHVYVYRDQSESVGSFTDRIKVWVDGEALTAGSVDSSPSTVEGFTFTGTSTTAGAAMTVRVGGPPDLKLATNPVPFDGQIAHVALFGTSASYTVGSDNGATGDTTGERFAEQIPALFETTSGSVELAQWFTAADSDNDIVMSAQPVKDATLHSLLTQVADTEVGGISVTGSGTVTLVPSTYTVNRATDLTLSAESSLMDLDGAFVLQDTQEVSQATITQQTVGSEWVKKRASGIGAESLTRDVWTTDGNHAEQVAYWWIDTARTAVQAPTLKVSVDRVAEEDPSLLGSLLTVADTAGGAVIVVEDLPATAPASTLTLTVTKVDHDITKNGWTVTINTAPGSTDGWVLDTSDLEDADCILNI